MEQAPAFVASVSLVVQVQVPQSCGQLFADTVQESPLMLQVPAFVASRPFVVQLQAPQICGQLFAAMVQEAPPTPRVPAFFASVPLGVQTQRGVDPQLFASTVQDVPLMRQTPASAASVRSAVQSQAPQGTGQPCVLQDWLSVSLPDPVQVPPHTSLKVMLLVLLLLCVPPPQVTLQAPQSPHCPQAPHSQSLGGNVPDTMRLVAQSPSLQPVLQVLVWVRD